MVDSCLPSSVADSARSHTPRDAPESLRGLDLDVLSPELAIRIFSLWRLAPMLAPPPSPATIAFAHVCVGPGRIAALDAMLAPRWGTGHAEDPARLSAIYAGLHPLWTQGFRWDLLPDEPHLIDDVTLRAVYVPQFVADFTSLEAGVQLKPRNVSLPNVSCALSPGQEFALAARFAAGTIMELALRGAARNWPDGLRSSDRLATRGTASSSGGNGVLNSVALAAVALSNAGHRVLIVDLDIHFSGGTSGDHSWGSHRVPLLGHLYYALPRLMCTALAARSCGPGHEEKAELGGSSSEQRMRRASTSGSLMPLLEMTHT